MNLFNAKYELDTRPIEEAVSVLHAALQQSLYPSSSESKGNAGNASLCTSQSVFL